MKIVVFDTETIGLDKPFCYNIGYVIIDTDDHWKVLLKKSYVVEQIWHNLALFSTAYYAEKRNIYVNEMRTRKTIMNKFGYICQQMIRDFKKYEVEKGFAYNSSFDEKVFEFNCDWFKCNNPFDNIPISDIRGFVHYFVVNDSYKEYCEEYKLFTETGNYSTTAETVYKYLCDDDSFIESHTALEDSIIESKILEECELYGADMNDDFTAMRSIERRVEKTLIVKTRDLEEYVFNYEKIRINKDKTKIILR